MPSVFVNPKVDYAFKIVFGSEQNEALLMSFLNAMLYKGESVITAVKIMNPYLPSEVETHKDTYVDVQAEINGQSFVLIEMQMLYSRAFFQRVLYNNAKRYSSHLVEGDPYTNLWPTISLIVADFVYNDEEPRPLTRFELRELESNLPYPAAKDFQIAVVELPKFQKPAKEAKSLADRWLFFLQNAKYLDEVPDEMAEVAEIDKAFRVAKRANLAQWELMAIDRRERDEAQRKRDKELAEEEFALALQQERQKGLQKGIEEGMDIGREEQKSQIVRQMLERGLDVEKIAWLTAVPLETIRRIADETQNGSA